jgi:hypothetical protein
MVVTERDELLDLPADMARVIRARKEKPPPDPKHS